jgi:hypothetical protein
MLLAFRAACAAFAERVPRLLAVHWFRWFNSVAPEAAASRRHPEMIGASPLTKVGCKRLFTDEASGAPPGGLVLLMRYLICGRAIHSSSGS